MSKNVNVEQGKQGFQPTTTGKSNIPTMADTAVLEASRTATAPPPVNYSDIHSRFATVTRGPEWVLRQTISKQIEIVTDPNISPELLHSVVADNHAEPEMLVHVARMMERLGSETVRELSRKPFTVIRCWAAWNRNLPADELPRLAKNRDVNIRQGVAEHPEASSSIVLSMGSRSSEEDRYVRITARQHPNYPKKAARLTMVQDRRTDESTLRVLAGDSIPQVANLAAKRLAAKGIVVDLFEDEDF